MLMKVVTVVRIFRGVAAFAIGVSRAHDAHGLARGSFGCTRDGAVVPKGSGIRGKRNGPGQSPIGRPRALFKRLSYRAA